MSHHLLFMALTCMIISYMNQLWIELFLIIIFLIYYIRHFQRHTLLYFCLLMLMLASVNLRMQPELPTTDIVVVKEIRSSYVIGEADGQKVILYSLEDINFGDVLKVDGDYQEIDGIHNDGEFYFVQWANRKGIYYSLNVKNYQVIRQGSSLRQRLYAKVQSMDETKKDWYEMMFFGIHDDNMYFMAMSSGMHIQMFIHLFTTIATIFFSSYMIGMVSVVMILLIGSSTCFSTSIIRILCSRILYILCPSLSSKDRLGMLIIILIIFFPSFIYEMGFLLPIIFHLVYVFNIHKIKRWKINLLILLPFQFWFYQYIDITQMLYFIVFRYLYGIAYMVTWLCLLLPICEPFLMLFSCMHQQISNFMLTSMKLYYLPNLIWLGLWIYEGISYLDTNHKRYLHSCILLMVYTQISPYLNPFFEIITIDVGQGDSTLFILPFHQGAMLLDVAGNINKDIPNDIIVPMLKKRGIHSLDLVVLTHDDFDHSGGLAQLQQQMDIKQVITTKQETVVFGPITFYMPLFDKIYESANDNSILLFFQLYDISMLFMGDGGYPCEEDLLKAFPNLKIDILKIGHHGSKHSSMPAFIHQLDPLIALISCGRHNRYGHPDDAVMETLDKEDVYPLVTAVQGSSSFYFSKFISFYKTADGEFGIIKHR